MAVLISSARLQLRTFEMADAEEVFACITPAVSRFMSWEPPKSFSEYKARREARLQAADPTEFTFVIRRSDTNECLGVTALEGADQPSPELGIWMKEAAHGQGYGGEAVLAVAKWAVKSLEKETFLYPVAVENTASRRIAEKLHGEIIGTRRSPKYDSVVYKIRAFAPSI
jgi:RimJ/RimL family protein N-acetyltransferase